MATLLSKRTLIIIITSIAILALAYFVLPVSIPLIAAFVTALFLSPVAQAMQNRFKIKRNLAVGIVFILFILFIGLAGYYATTQLITQGVALVENLPQYINEINRVWLNFQRDLETEYANLPPEIVQEINIQVTRTLNDIRGVISERNLINDVASFISSIPAYLIMFIVYLIALFLFTLELPTLKKKVFNYLSERTKEKVNFMTARLKKVFWGFFKAQLQVSIIIFICSLIGLLFIAPEVALIMSLLIWIIDLIPLVGSIIVLAPWAGYHLIVGNYTMAIHLLILASILLIIRRTVEPKVMGQNIGLSPLATLIAMYLGAVFFGILGFILGPLILIIFTSAREAGIIKIKFKI